MNNIKITQRNIKVRVEYYNKEEEAKFQSYPSVENIQEIVRTGEIEIPIEEFLTYYLFYRKRPGSPGHRNYAELGRKIGKSFDELEGWIEFNGDSISASKEAKPLDNHVTERIAESVALSVVNRLHNLTDADWGRIPQNQGVKVFDFDLTPVASDGINILQVEAKGSCVKEADKKTSSISNHKAGIDKKKVAVKEQLKDGDPPHLLYGAITVVNYDVDGVLKCLLVDPEPERVTTQPQKLRLINRMRFLRDWICFMSPRSQLASAIATRTADLEVMKDPFELDGIPLIKGSMDQFRFESFPHVPKGSSSSFFHYRSHLTDGPSGGIITRISRNALLFLGFREELLQYAANQDFSAILSYKSQSGVVSKTVRCLLTERRFNYINLSERITRSAKIQGGYVSFNLKGNIAFNNSGIVFGILPTNETE